MKIEVIVILLIFFIFFAWAIWHRVTNWLLIRKYNPDENKSRKGEEQRKSEIARIAGGDLKVKSTGSNLSRPSKFVNRQLLPTASLTKYGQDISSIGKPSKSNERSRNPFRRRKK